jgi:hypothetical protein
MEDSSKPAPSETDNAEMRAKCGSIVADVWGGERKPSAPSYSVAKFGDKTRRKTFTYIGPAEIYCPNTRIRRLQGGAGEATQQTTFLRP